MVMAPIDSVKFNWRPLVVEADDPEVFTPRYVVTEEAETRLVYVKSRFAELPSATVWADRAENDDELLEHLAGDWRGFGNDQ